MNKQKVVRLDVVALTQELPDRDLPLGQVGTVVEFLAPDVYEVEFTITMEAPSLNWLYVQTSYWSCTTNL